MIIDFLNGKSAEKDKSRIERVLQAAYLNSLAPKGAQDRQFLTAEYQRIPREDHPAKTMDIREIIEAGVQALGETMGMLQDMPLSQRLDVVYLKGLTACTRAAVEIAKDQRDAADFLARQRLDDASLNKLLREHLAKMPPEQLAELLPRFGDTMSTEKRA